MIIQIQTPLNVFYNTFRRCSQAEAEATVNNYGPAQYVLFKPKEQFEDGVHWGVLPTMSLKDFFSLDCKLNGWQMYWSITMPEEIAYYLGVDPLTISVS